MSPNLAAVLTQQQQNLDEYGFYIHAVMCDEDYPQGCNVHTHGLAEHFNHPDLQMCVPMPPTMLLHILHNAVAEIRAGRPLVPGHWSSEIIEPYPVHFIAACENGRPVVRLIFPDPKGRYEDGTWAWQYESLHLDQLPAAGAE